MRQRLFQVRLDSSIGLNQLNASTSSGVPIARPGRRPSWGSIFAGEKAVIIRLAFPFLFLLRGVFSGAASSDSEVSLSISVASGVSVPVSTVSSAVSEGVWLSGSLNNLASGVWRPQVLNWHRCLH